MRTARITAVVVAASVIGLALPATPSMADAGADQTIIVTLDSGKGDPVRAAADAVETAGGTVSRTRAISDRSVAVTVSDVTTTAARAIGEAVSDQSGVTAAQPSRRLYPATAAPRFADLWNLNAAGRVNGVDAEDAWSTSTGAGVVVGVIDTGMTKHSDLSSASSIVGGNVIPGYDFISEPTNAGDGGGVDPDPTDPGDYTATDRSTWHGTHVAGIIAAIKDNDEGVVGVAPSASIEPLRVLGRNGGSESDIIAAISWGAGLPVPGVPANPRPASVLNLSLSGGGLSSNPSDYTCSTAMQTAIDAAVAKGTAIVVPAGNNQPQGAPLRYYFPGNCSNVIRVTATGPTGALASYSNYGTADFPATLAAPGTAIWSTLNSGATGPGAEDYGQLSGTSMAVPHVAGTIALLQSARLKAGKPPLTVAQLVGILTKTATPVAGCTATGCGAGIVNAAAAVAAATASFTAARVTLARPAISGTPRVRSTLTASVSGYAPSGGTVSWQWLRNGVPIPGASFPSYTAQPSDLGRGLSVRATVRYFDTTAVETSSPVTVAGLTFAALARPKIRGTDKVRSRLTAKAGAVRPAATRKTYQWLRNGKPIAKATRSSYRLVKADRNRRISVRVTVSRSGYVSRSATSSAHKVR